MLQESIWEGNWIGQPNRLRYLRNTLSKIWQQRLTDIWKLVTHTVELRVQYNIAIERLAIQYLQSKANNTIFPLMSRKRCKDPKFTIGFPWLSKIKYHYRKNLRILIQRLLFVGTLKPEKF